MAFKLYPRRAMLGLALFIGQAFLYNGVTFNLGTLLSGFYAVTAGEGAAVLHPVGVEQFPRPLGARAG